MTSSRGSAPTVAIVEETVRIIGAAGDRGLTLRAIGSAGVRLSVADERLFERLGRETPIDIDLVASSTERAASQELFDGLGYEIDRQLVVAAEGTRYAFLDERSGTKVDLFFDKLRMCHGIDLRKRFQLTSPAVPPADLLLSKMQIVELNRKDLLDAAALLIADDARDRGLDAAYIGSVLADDWGFFHTCERNLARIRLELLSLNLADAERGRILDSLDRIEAAMAAANKSLRWRVRARVGERIRWYELVTDDTDVY